MREDKEQIKIAEKISNLFNSGVKNVVLEAPTGSGKSGIAWFTHKLSNLSSCVLSHQKVLQDQYNALLNDKSNFITLKGKGNYQCSKFKNLTAEMAPCSFCNYPCLFKKSLSCEYFRLRNFSKKSTFLNSNYQQILSLYDVQTDFELNKDLYIFDECHNLPNIYTDFRTVKIGTLDQKMYLKLKEFSEEEELDDLLSITNKLLNIFKSIDYVNAELDQSYAEEVFNEVFSLKTNVSENLQKLMDENLDNLIETGKIKTYGIFANYESKMISKFETIKSRWNISDENSLVVERNRNENDKTEELKLIPLDIGPFFSLESQSFSEKRLFMSSTIFGGERFLKELGLENEKNEIIYLDSKFPVDNRLVFQVPIKFLNNKILSDPNTKELDDYFEAMENIILDCSKDNESGVIFTSSYKFTSMIVNRISNVLRKNNIELFYNLKIEERDSVLQDFIVDSGKPKVLISPSFFEGVNFNDEISRYQIIAKVPYKSLASKYVKVKLDKDPLDYSLSALKLIVQASGRSIRSKDDYAKTFILDANWNRVYKQCKKFVPKWFNDALVEI